MAGLVRLPSPAMVVGLVALVAALGGSAVALPGKNRVDKNDINRNAVGAKQIRAGAVGGSEAKNNALTGADINEGSLAKVPSAASADTANSANSAATATAAGSAVTAADAAAIEGQKVSTFTAFIPTNQSNSNIANLGGIQLEGNCNAGGINLYADNSSGLDGRLMVEGQGVIFGLYFEEEAPFTGSSNFPVIEEDSDRGQSTLSAFFSDGSVTTAVVSGSTQSNNPQGCRLWGRVISG